MERRDRRPAPQLPLRPPRPSFSSPHTPFFCLSSYLPLHGSLGFFFFLFPPRPAFVLQQISSLLFLSRVLLWRCATERLGYPRMCWRAWAGGWSDGWVPRPCCRVTLARAGVPQPAGHDGAGGRRRRCWDQLACLPASAQCHPQLWLQNWCLAWRRGRGETYQSPCHRLPGQLVCRGISR